ncbi:MAG TPA: metalloregulator ArsR/SmtB family transcription factor [Streptosporangiaceae bacterium]
MTAQPGRPRKTTVATAARGHADRFAAVADSTRRHLLEDLAAADRTVSELGSGLDISQAAVSQHLRVLREAGLVSAQRDGRHRLYQLMPAALTELRDWLDELERFWRERLATLGDYLDAESQSLGQHLGRREGEASG